MLAHADPLHSHEAPDIGVSTSPVIGASEHPPSLPVSPTRTASPAFPVRGRALAPSGRPIFRAPFGNVKGPQLAASVISPPSSRAASVSHHSAGHGDETSVGLAPGSFGPLSSSQAPSQRAARLEVYAELKYLQRENLLLRNELNFELYLKDQHLHHIGRLHRDRITDNALEAERQNLYQIVKSLRAQVSQLTQSQDRQRAETSTTKARHAQWENELNAKLKSYREERRTWTTESRELKAQLEQCHATIASQARRLDEASSEMFELKRSINEMAPKVAKVAEYEAKTLHLTKCLTYWDDDVKKYELQRREMEILLSRWKAMEMLLESSEADRWNLAEEAEYRRIEAEKLTRELVAVRTRASDALAKASITVLPRDSGAGSGFSAATIDRLEELEGQVLALQARAQDAESEKDFLRKALEEERQRQQSQHDSRLPVPMSASASTTASPRLAPSAPTVQTSTTSMSVEHALGTLEPVGGGVAGEGAEDSSDDTAAAAAATAGDEGGSAAGLQRILDEEVQPLELNPPVRPGDDEQS